MLDTSIVGSSVASPKCGGRLKKLGGTKCLILGEKYYFTWDTLRLKAQNDYTLQKLGRGIAR